MCGGGGGGGSSKPTPAPAAAPAAPVFSGNATVKGANERGGRISQSRRQRARNAKDNLKMALDVSVANVGGSGKTGLNIPQPKG